MSSKRIFHAHVYYTPETRESAERIRVKASNDLKVLGVSRLIDRAVGPHPMPMFEIDFDGLMLGEVVTWLHQHHGLHSVLVHEDKKPETREHTVNAIWVGPPVALDLSQLDLGTDDVHNKIMK